MQIILGTRLQLNTLFKVTIIIIIIIIININITITIISKIIPFEP
jgi:hypothetical protein